MERISSAHLELTYVEGAAYLRLLRSRWADERDLGMLLWIPIADIFQPLWSDWSTE